MLLQSTPQSQWASSNYLPLQKNLERSRATSASLGTLSAQWSSLTVQLNSGGGMDCSLHLRLPCPLKGLPGCSFDWQRVGEFHRRD
jgi:hypothetical protein